MNLHNQNSELGRIMSQEGVVTGPDADVYDLETCGLDFTSMDGDFSSLLQQLGQHLETDAQEELAGQYSVGENGGYGDNEATQALFSEMEPLTNENLPFETYETGSPARLTGGKVSVADSTWYEPLQSPAGSPSGQQPVLYSVGSLPESPSRWEDYHFRFDQPANAVTISGCGGGVRIKQEIPDSPGMTPCAFSVPRQPVPTNDVKESLKTRIKQRSGVSSLATWTAPEGANRARGHATDDVMRKERRREQNRRAAQKCREKKRRQLTLRQKDYDQAMIENRQRKREVEQLREKVSRLEQTLQEHTARCNLPGLDNLHL